MGRRGQRLPLGLVSEGVGNLEKNAMDKGFRHRGLGRGEWFREVAAQDFLWGDASSTHVESQVAK